MKQEAVELMEQLLADQAQELNEIKARHKNQISDLVRDCGLNDMQGFEVWSRAIKKVRNKLMEGAN
jgi:hypothetical protein